MLDRILNIAKANEEIERLTAENEAATDSATELINEIGALKDALAERDLKIEEMTDRIEGAAEEIGELKEEAAEVEEVAEEKALAIAASVGAADIVAESDEVDESPESLWQQYHAFTHSEERNAFYRDNRNKLFKN